VSRTTARWPRTVVHADMDAFYAAVEQLDHPELRGRPILVGPPSGRGVVLTASYEARPFDVGSAMPMVEARRRCPEALVVPPRFSRYREVSGTIMRTFREFSPQVEALSLDEAFLDMSGAEHIFGAPTELGARIKSAISAATGGLSVSVGISGTKYVAKVASGFRKPDGLTIVPPAEARAWLAPLPVRKLWGAGPKMQARLAAAGFVTIGDVARADLALLVREFGRVGAHFKRLACAEDARTIQSERGAKSISSERTFEADIAAAAEIEFHLRRAAEHVASRLRREQYVAGGVRLKLKTARFKILTRQCALPTPVQAGDVLFRAVRSLLPDVIGAGPFRLVGVGAFDLSRVTEDGAHRAQLGLLTDTQGERRAKLEHTLDALEARFGPGVVQRAGELTRTRDLGIVSDRPEPTD
jgi:DNA polymerase IV